MKMDLSVTARSKTVRPRTVAAFGDVTHINCFGGSPKQFLDEARRQNFAEEGWRLDIGKLKGSRIIWNALQPFRGRRTGGFQFSATCRANALAQVPSHLLKTEVISFHQTFPPPDPIIRAGGELNLYIDATYTQLFPSYGLDRTIDGRMLKEAIDYEREVFFAAKRVIVNQSWTYRSLLSDYGLSPKKCAVILPAANYPTFPGICTAAPEGRPGVDRPFVLGFIGKDWRRKGLLFLDRVAAGLRSKGWKVKIRAIGFPSDQLPPDLEIDSLGFIDKRTEFAPFLHSCDVGCLFSSAEAAGIAVLEFMGAGVPVAGFTVNGLADLLPNEAGFRFPVNKNPEEIVETFDCYLRDEDRQIHVRAAARRLAPFLTWERCVREFQEFWASGEIDNPLRLYKSSPTAPVLSHAAKE